MTRRRTLPWIVPPKVTACGTRSWRPSQMQIEQFDDRVIFRYEYWNAVRTVYLDERAYPADAPHTRLGHSIGRYEGDTLIVETTHVIPNVIGVPGRGALPPDKDTRFIERYTYHADNGKLDLELAIIDPVNFRKPYDNQRSFSTCTGLGA